MEPYCVFTYSMWEFASFVWWQMWCWNLVAMTRVFAKVSFLRNWTNSATTWMMRSQVHYAAGRHWIKVGCHDATKKKETHKNHLIVESNHVFVSEKWQKSVTCAAFHQKECEEEIKNLRRCSWSETWICVCLDSWGAESSVKNLIHTGPAAKRIFIL